MYVWTATRMCQLFLAEGDISNGVTSQLHVWKYGTRDLAATKPNLSCRVRDSLADQLNPCHAE